MDYIFKFYIKKALLINKRDINTISIKKELDKFTESSNNKMLLILIGVFVIGISLIIIFNLKQKQDKISSLNNNITNNTQIEDIDNNIEENIEDIEGVDELIPSIESIEEEIFTSEDIEKYYIGASTNFEDGNYLDAKINLNKIVSQSKGNHLNDDILFLLGSTYEKLEDINNSIKYFEEYISQYENGDYIEEVYYKLALNYKNINLENAKIYANKLIYNYPESIYNNSKIDSIISN